MHAVDDTEAFDQFVLVQNSSHGQISADKQNGQNSVRNTITICGYIFQ